MTYEDLIKDLCDVIKESENNATQIYEIFENINEAVDSYEIIEHEKNKIKSKVSTAFGLLQHQDLYRQKIEKVVNHVCDRNSIDKTQFNLAASAKNIDSEDNISEDELAALISSMQK